MRPPPLSSPFRLKTPGAISIGNADMINISLATRSQNRSGYDLQYPPFRLGVSKFGNILTPLGGSTKFTLGSSSLGSGGL